ncbi:amino acid ABC transporter permease [Paenibacillus sp. SI8]|uniref:amino acid ABC transporter permease n=1 Tax=unclassified Paenibacillus TaxID=185978 RepID=UPI0034656F44
MINFSLEFAIQQFPLVLKAVPMTLLVAVISMLLGLVFGFLIALCRLYEVPVLQRFAALYVSFIRGTPLLVQIYVIYYGTPALFELLNRQFGWHLPANDISPLAFALLAFTINAAAYESEIIRSALKTTDSGQMEAAHAIGMTTRQGLFRIIIPQALVVALPNFGNIFIGLIKGTSLAFAVKVIEIMAVAKIVAGDGYRYLEMYLDASIVYWIICFAFERLFAALEHRAGRYEEKMTL